MDCFLLSSSDDVGNDHKENHDINEDTVSLILTLVSNIIAAASKLKKREFQGGKLR